ncbi:MAG: DMT family transporter [Pseudomonadota bacterium]
MTERLPVVLALGSALLWGVWWIPVRAIEEAGLEAVWAGFAMNLGGLPGFVLAALIWHRGRGFTARAAAGALLAGVAVTTYSAALTYTDVIRVALLFYLAPVWSKLIEVVFFGERWTWTSTLAIALSFAGIITIFRGEVALEDWSVGDLMAVGSGMAWATGAALIFSGPTPNGVHLSLGMCVGAILTCVLLIAVGGPSAGAWPTAEGVAAAAPVALGAGALYLVPVMVVTLWAATRLPPATMSFLLTTEIISGVGSAALLLDERFGAPEVIGAVLVALGATIEVIAPHRRRPAN